MNPSEWIIGRILPYLALVVGCGGLLLRVRCWLRTPAPFFLTIFPLPTRRTQRLAVLGRELFLQSGLHRFSPGLWLWTWLFHLSLAAIPAGHVLGFCFPENPFRLFGLSASFGRQLSRRRWRATLNDSCNYARSCGLVEPPRRLLRACVEDFV